MEASRARPRTGCGHRSPRRSSPRSRNRGRRRPSGPGQPTTGATTSTMNRDRTRPPPTRLRTGRGPTCPPGLGRQLRVAGIRRKLPRGGPQQRRHRLGWLTPSLDRRPLGGSRDGGPVLQLTSGSAQIFPVRRRDLPRASDRVSVGRSTRARGVAWARGCRAPSTRARRGARSPGRPSVRGGSRRSSSLGAATWRPRRRRTGQPAAGASPSARNRCGRKSMRFACHVSKPCGPVVTPANSYSTPRESSIPISDIAKGLVKSLMSPV